MESFTIKRNIFPLKKKRNKVTLQLVGFIFKAILNCQMLKYHGFYTIIMQAERYKG